VKIIALILLFFVQTAWAADTVLCGDDDDNGVVDLIKTAGLVDRDCDGEASVADGGYDCDDTSARIHNGSVTTSGCTAQYRTCTNGVYSACTSANIAEKTNNYYVSATGSGTTCSYASPCLPSAVSSGGAVTIVAPAAVYTVGSTDFSGSMIMNLTVAGSSNSVRNLLARDPLSTAKWNTNAGCAAPCSTIKVTANNWDIRGHEVTGGDTTSSGGIRVSGANISVFDNYVHDAAGANNNNLAGIYVDGSGSAITVRNNIINDTYDPTRTLAASDRQNTWNLGAFVGQGHQFYNNIVGYSHAVNTAPLEKQGGGIRIKHAQPAASVTAVSEIKNNIIYNTEISGIALLGAGEWGHGNLEVGVSHCFGTGDSGNASLELTNIKFYNNTCVAGAHLTLGTETGGAIDLLGNAFTPDLGGTAGGWNATGNVINDSAQTTYGGGNFINLFRISPYGSNADFTTYITGGVVTLNNNCYYNSVIGAALTTGFGVYADSAAAFGSNTNFAGWQSTYSQDSTGVVGNMALDSNYRYTAICPSNIGWSAEWPTASSSSASARKGQKNGSGRKGQK